MTICRSNTLKNINFWVPKPKIEEDCFLLEPREVGLPGTEKPNNSRSKGARNLKFLW